MLLESEEGAGTPHYALIDSNDTSLLRSSYIFLKKFFEKRNVTVPSTTAIFDWVMLTHAHADHGEGLQTILKHFGAKRFWYSTPANKPAWLAALLRYATQSNRVEQYDVVDTGKILPPFGAASINVLWPIPGHVSPNENDNSVVLVITLGKVSLVLSGDAEADGVWTKIAKQIPRNVRFFKVPHHGSPNGTFASEGTTPWLSRISRRTKLGISSHVRPYEHPDQTVVDKLAPDRRIYRTDKHYHVTFETNGENVNVTYSHGSHHPAAAMISFPEKSGPENAQA